MRVRLVDVPVALFCAAEQHTNDLLREVALMAAGRSDLEVGHLFSEMLSSADAYAHRPAAVRQHLAEAVTLALSEGRESVTVDVQADAAAAEGARMWEELLRRFDAMSRDEQLLTLPADPEVTAYRAWYARELLEQVQTGRAPVSWQVARLDALAGAR
jgi:nitric oxide synthase oxygenase domain/subunit